MESSPLNLNPIQQLNFCFLHVVRDAARADAVSACCSFGLSRDQLQAVASLSPDDVLKVVARLGGEALFAPRDDLGTLVATPVSVLPLVASSRSRVAARSSARSS